MQHDGGIHFPLEPVGGRLIFGQYAIGMVGTVARDMLHGSVEIRELVEILQHGAPDPDSTPNCMEPPCLPDYDPQLWMRLSIEWLESNCAEFFPRRFDTTRVG